MIGGAPLTVTDSWRAATFIVKLIVTASPTPRRKPSLIVVPNPESSAATL